MNKDDFKPTILKPNYKAVKQNTHPTPDKTMLRVENGEIKLQTAPREMGIAMQQARKAKNNMTQDELAKKCNVKKSVINSYENGSTIVQQSVLDKINKVLGTTLKRPKPIKIENLTNKDTE